MIDPAVHTRPAAATAEPWTDAGWRSAPDLLSIIAGPARHDPQGAALHLLTYPPGEVKVETVRWREIWDGAAGFAARLRQAGVEPGDRVLVALPTGRGWLSAFFGTLAAGAVPVPAAPPVALRGRRLEAQREILVSLTADAAAAAAVLPAASAELLRDSLELASPGLQCLDAGEQATLPAAVDHPWRPDPDATALIQYTSGSTSRPKGVVLTHRNILANALAITEALYHDPARACILSWLPLYHDMGLIGGLLTALYARVSLILMTPQDFVKDPSRWLRAVSDFRATVTAAPNFAFAYCAESVDPAALAGVRLNSLYAVLNGAEPVDAMAVRRFEQTFAPLGLRQGAVRPVYGLAESALAVTFSEAGDLRVERIDSARLERDGTAVPACDCRRSRELISVGRPIEGQQVRVADAADRSLPERRVGQVLVRGASVMRGYFRRDEETAAALAGGWLHTGDLGYLADGQLFLVGRASELIIRYGRNHHPEDLETHVGRVPAVHPGGAAVFTVDGEGGGRVAVVVVAETRERDTAARAELVREIHERIHLACEFGPDDIVLVPPGTIPRTTSGKVQRRHCRRLYCSGAWSAPGGTA